MSRYKSLGLVSWMMAAETRDESAQVNEDSSDDDDEPFEGRTFFDFESDDSVPNLTVKTFLRDCLKHPKILLHKDFDFFRGYLVEVGFSFSLPSGAPYSENHEDATFCVDKNDKWLAELRRRVDVENKDFYWASIIPMQRKSDLGLIQFKWEPLPLSIHFLHVYLKFCESRMEEHESGEYLDEYIRDFKEAFNIEKNIDIEARFKDDEEAKRIRKLENKDEPKMTRELALLLKTPPKRSQVAVNTTEPSKPKVKEVYGRRKDMSSSSDSETTSESDSSSETGSSSGSEYKCGYTKRKPKTMKPKRKVTSTKRNGKNQRKVTSINPSKTVASLNQQNVTSSGSRTAISHDPRNAIVSLSRSIICTKNQSSSSNVKSTKPQNGMNFKKINGKLRRNSPSLSVSSSSGSSSSSSSGSSSGRSRSCKRTPPPTLTFACTKCEPKRTFINLKKLYQHLITKHETNTRVYTPCPYCGQKVRKAIFEIHKQYCPKRHRRLVSVGKGR